MVKITLADFSHSEIAVMRGIGLQEREEYRGAFSTNIARKRLDDLGLREVRRTPKGRKVFEKLTPAGLEVLKLIRADDAKRAAEQRTYEFEQDRRERVKEAGPKLLEALKPFALEADTWADTVPDEHRSLCFEPGAKHAHPGSETTFTVGDLRRARAAYREATEEPKESES